MQESENVSHWINLVKDGDSIAANRIWHLYFERLVGAVRRRIQGQNRATSDEEDIVLSVFDSFYQAAEAGRFPDLADRGDLWRLLLTMAGRKVIDKYRREQRQKRGGEIKIRSFEEDSVLQVIGNEPSPEIILMMQESVEQLFSHLGVGQLRDLAGAKLEGYSNAEIASRMGCSERTIERRLHLIREKLRQELIPQNDESSRKTDDHRP